jgi:DNA-binding CsgD family transcriptional regulator
MRPLRRDVTPLPCWHAETLGAGKRLVSSSICADTINNRLRSTGRAASCVEGAARGFSNNRQIAKELSMSIRTVESHLYRASGRSGASNRGELSALFRDFERVRTSRIRYE